MQSKCKQFANAHKMQKQITCNLNKSRLKQPNAGGVCYVTHFRTYIITHDRGQREAASISVFHLFINGIVRGGKVQNKIKDAGKVGPLWGGLLGIMPQCGFSAAAASLYAGRVITVGTLLAVFLSTSDEMLPIFISESVALATIIKILAAKVCIAIISGFLAELVYVNVFKKKEKDMDIHVVCEEEHCSCEDGVLKSALKHTLKIFVYILLITFILTLVIEMIGEDHLAVVFQNIPVVGEMIAALVGLIPNCASSVVITELYLSGIIGAGAMMSGLLVNAGVGLLVLFRLNRNWKQNAGIMAALYGFGVVWGVIIELLGIVF